MKSFIQVEPENYHYFAANLSRWKVSKNLESLIDDMKKDECFFMVYLVPVDISANYSIIFFKPKIEGTILVGQWEIDFS